jgi:3-hydroxy acid dehydrogenase/malonic semialdehyde reductase
MPRAPYLPKTVLITGATGDFGRAFAARFYAAGCNVIACGRDAKKLGALSKKFPKIHALCFDITDKNAMQQSVQSLPKKFQNIDLLINNAGLALGLDPSHLADINDWETMIAVNNTALVRLTRLILPGMAARKKGHIINIGSIAGNYFYPGANVYGGTKAFVKHFSMNLRADLAGTNIRVTNIEPGMVETQFSAVRFKGDRKKAASVYADTKPLKPEDVSESVFWAATLPPHFNVNRMEIMPTVQSFGPLPVERFR